VLTGGQCVQQCPNGSGANGSCTACNFGYILSGGSCVLECPNGSGAAGSCTACNNGYALSGGSCLLLCANGTGFEGSCTTCSNGYILSGGSCLLPAIGSFSASPTRVRKNMATPVSFSWNVSNPTPSCTISGPSGFTPLTINPVNGWRASLAHLSLSRKPPTLRSRAVLSLRKPRLTLYQQRRSCNSAPSFTSWRS